MEVVNGYYDLQNVMRFANFAPIKSNRNFIAFQKNS